MVTFAGTLTHNSNHDQKYSRRDSTEEWAERLIIIDSITIVLLYKIIFKGAGRHPMTRKKNGGIKVYSIVLANAGYSWRYQSYLDCHQQLFKDCSQTFSA
ncbi:MAG: hypothetical protein IJ764_03350 [Bacteroidales bacterium]|nr:hypothetical protein [Bacteroidales bacterium]